LAAVMAKLKDGELIKVKALIDEKWARLSSAS
jgi:hypothetical protein